MRASAKSTVLIAALGSTLLSGCWLFPPFFPPLDPGGAQIVVDNRTDADWVVELRADFPTAFAVPAGEAGTIESWGTEPGTLVLMTPECAEVDEVELTTEETSVAVEEPGTLTVSEAPAGAGELEPFAEYWQCDIGGSFGVPHAERPLPGATAATGTILLYGEDGVPYRFDPVAGAVDAAFADAGAATFFDLDHTWSPEGTRVAYSHGSETTASTDIYVAAADGSGAELLIENAMAPRWSPQGDRIAYQDADPFSSDAGIWTVDLQTDERTLVAENASSPAWSPDGTRLAYVSAEPFSTIAEPGPSEVHVVNADGSGDRAIGETSPFSLPPAWSPDGTKLAFGGLPDGAFDFMSFELTIVVFDLEGGALTTVAAVEGATLSEPAWSPDGSMLAFSASETSLFGVTAYTGLVDPTGGEIAQLGGGDGAFVSSPTWSPDGDWIVVSEQGGLADFSVSLVAYDPSDAAAVGIELATGVMSIIAWRPM